MPIVFSEHAQKQLERRGISQKLVIIAVKNPQEILSSFRGRKLRRIQNAGKLLEVITKTEGSRITVITGYYLEDTML